MSDTEAVMESYKDADLSGLSDEEAAALSEEGAEDEAEAEAPQEGEQNDDSAVVAEQEDAASSEEADEVAQSDDPKDPFVPRYRVDEAEADASLDEALAALDAKFEEGELSATEYRKALAEINNPVLIEQAKRAAMQEISQQNAEQLWQRQQDEFFELYPEYRDSKVKFAGLEAALQDLYGDEKNSGKSGAWFLREAKSNVDKELGIRQEPVETRTRQKPDLPKSLGNVPRADQESTGDKYSALDGLDGLELEAAIAKLSDSDLEAFGKVA